MAITWTDNIKQQFRPFDISHMKQITGNALKLDDYESVKTWAGQIWVQVSNGYMPPGNPWGSTPETANYKQNFKTWMDTGMPFGTADTPSTGTPSVVTWKDTIKGQFRTIDIDHMKQVSGGSIDLSDYTSVKANGDDIYGMVSTHAMPPDTPWSSQFIDNFKAWMDAGYPENGTLGAVTWTDTIKGQFRTIDIDHMKQVSGGSIDLSDYTSVKANGDDIYGMVSTNAMPPDTPWSSQFIDNFKAWMDAGYPEN